VGPVAGVWSAAEVALGRCVAVAGGTGLVGRFAVEALLADSAWDEVVVYGRRAPEHTHPKLRVVLGPLAEVEQRLGHLQVDDGLCCLGTTIKTAGSQAAFRAVDHEGVLAFAKVVRAQGASRFALVSSVGASAGASVFYSRVKGEAERDVASLDFRALFLLRPSILLGDRGEHRPAEAIGMALARRTGFLMVGPLSPYRGIHAADVARAAVSSLRGGEAGTSVLHYAELMAAAGQQGR
jgi:uncharacterized protein YbjT (DUF2867 family)